MKNICLFLILFISLQTSAQNEKHALKLGYIYGTTSYLGATGNGYNVQYDFSYLDRFSATVGYGQFSGVDSRSGRFSGISGGIPYDETYEISSFEGHNFFEIGGTYSYFRKWNIVDLKFGGGIALLSNWVNYQENIIFLFGEIIEEEFTRRQENLGLINFVLENDFKITNQLIINAKLIIRKSIAEHTPLIREINGTVGRSTSTSYIDDASGSFVIGLGYRF